MTDQNHAYEIVAVCAETHGLVDLADAIRDLANTDDMPAVDNVALCRRRYEEHANAH